jgi:hypothetical protein
MSNARHLPPTAALHFGPEDASGASTRKKDLGGSTEILDSVDATELSLPALLCPEPSAQQVLLDSLEASGKVFNLPLMRTAEAKFSGRCFGDHDGFCCEDYQT